jgi:hypothetical protein
MAHARKLDPHTSHDYNGNCYCRHYRSYQGREQMSRLSDRMQDTANALIESNSANTDVVTKALDSMFDYGIESERERIIKLLDSDDVYSTLAYHIYTNGDPEELKNDLIALIKGENKWLALKPSPAS